MAQVAIDLFEKARTHDRLEQLRDAREQDLLPYFRLIEGKAGPSSRWRATSGSSSARTTTSA